MTSGRISTVLNGSFGAQPHRTIRRPLFGAEENPFPWMSEALDPEEGDEFFETRVTEWQSGGALDWD